MQLHFLGAAREVTGSLFLLETDAGSLLVDCGMVQGRRAESDERNRRLPREAVRADAAILTHAHIDHSGSLPTLVRRGFTGAIHATPATRDVAELMLADSARIQAADAEYLNRRFGADPGWRPLVPLYDEDDVAATMKRFVVHSYHAPFAPLPGVRACFYDAGHILGSAQLVLDVDAGRDVRSPSRDEQRVAGGHRVAIAEGEGKRGGRDGRDVRGAEGAGGGHPRTSTMGGEELTRVHAAGVV